MINKWFASMYMLAPIVAFNLFRFVIEPINHPHPGVHQDWWMRGEAYAGITLLAWYVMIALLFIFSKEDKT